MSDVLSFDDHRPTRTRASSRVGKEPLVVYDRAELDTILQLYSRMVMAGDWRDYALGFGKHEAVFSIFRHTSEGALYRIVKRPKLARKQGAYAVISADNRILRRGRELIPVLKVLEKKALKLV
jgi:hypothetical protein